MLKQQKEKPKSLKSELKRILLGQAEAGTAPKYKKSLLRRQSRLIYEVKILTKVRAVIIGIKLLTLRSRKI